MSTEKIVEVVKFQIRDELQDWFEQMINEKYGPNIQLRYSSDDSHFSQYIQVEISGSERRLDDAIKFIRNTSEELSYKIPWLSENTYYVGEERKKKQVTRNLNVILNGNDTFDTTKYLTIGRFVFLFIFRSDVINTKKMEIDKIFKIAARREQQFIILPSKSTIVQHQSFTNISSNILTLYHGNFLKFLSLEDILSLELANKWQDSCYDEDLNRDIQNYLQRNWPEFYADEKIVDFLGNSFKISEVLRFFLQKYHHCLASCYDSTVLTAKEIQSLSQTYNIEMRWREFIHNDFKTTNASHFCIFLHSETDIMINATENRTIINFDGSLDHSNKTTKYISGMTLKSQNNCSPQQTISMIQWVAKRFRHFRNIQELEYLVLSKFDLNQVSSKIFNDLLISKPDVIIQFYKMNFNWKTLSVLLEQSEQKTFIFKNCQISAKDMDIIFSKTNQLLFEAMDIELNIINALICPKLIVFCCRITSNWGFPVNKITGDQIKFKHSKFDTLTLLRFLKMLHSATRLEFQFCELIDCDILDMQYFAIRNDIYFGYMSINIKTVFQIFEFCQFQNEITFDSCHFYLENISHYTFSLKPVNELIFRRIRFDALTLITILAQLHNGSRVNLEDCTILPLCKNIDISNKSIKLKTIRFESCWFETSTLFSILEISKGTDFIIMSCDLMPSIWEWEVDVTSIFEMQTKITFYDMLLVPRFIRLLLQTNSKFVFDSCGLNFMKDSFAGSPIQCKSVSFINKTFNLLSHFQSLVDFTCKSGITFENCHFDYPFCPFPDVVLAPDYINFEKIIFYMEKLFSFLETISGQTPIYFTRCRFQATNPMYDLWLISIKRVYFKEMICEISQILYLLKKCLWLESLHFTNCQFEPENMNRNNILSTMLEKLKYLLFEDVPYSPNLLQILKYLNETCVVEYYGQLSNHEIIEICTKTNVNGKRLRLYPKVCTETIYFELFAEFVRPMALNAKFDSEKEYDLPVHLLPVIFGCEIQHDWRVIQIKYVLVNDVTVKLEFLKNSKPIDLFFEINDLTDDSSEFIVDYS